MHAEFLAADVNGEFSEPLPIFSRCDFNAVGQNIAQSFPLTIF